MLRPEIQELFWQWCFTFLLEYLFLFIRSFASIDSKLNEWLKQLNSWIAEKLFTDIRGFPEDESHSHVILWLFS